MNFFDRRIHPMEPRPSKTLPLGETYGYQVKWDGMRLLAFGRGSELRLQGKSLRDKTSKYPELSGLTRLVRAEEFILDGELIALVEGRPCFYSLMRREHSGSSYLAGRNVPVFYMIFDCLYLDGAWLVEQPWECRQEMLGGALQENETVRICANYDDGESLLAGVEKQNLEGVVAKKRGSPYVSGPRESPYWLKTKLEQQILTLVGGLLLRDQKVVSLLLGLEEGNGSESGRTATLRYIGNVSSGLTEKDLAEWQKWGRRHAVSDPPFRRPLPAAGREVIWVEPLRGITVTFNEWTPELKLRAPRVGLTPL
ncbi:MAG: hypothetical protein AB1796_03055 [Bacillota bacterium]